jgi:hypothetical protein
MTSIVYLERLTLLVDSIKQEQFYLIMSLSKDLSFNRLYYVEQISLLTNLIGASLNFYK